MARTPFSVHYSGPVTVTSYELFSATGDLKKPSDIKALRVEQGKVYGITFYCENNTGAELLCCLKSSHDCAQPDWLAVESEEDVNMTYGADYAVSIKAKGIDLCAGTDVDVDSLELTGFCLTIYNLEDEIADYIILEQDGQPIKIGNDGYLLKNPSERIKRQKVIDLEALEEDASLDDASTRDELDAQEAWLTKFWEAAFPRSTLPPITRYAP